MKGGEEIGRYGREGEGRGVNVEFHH